MPKQRDPTSTAVKSLILVGALLVFFLAKAYVHSRLARTSANGAQYDGNGFSMTVPAGSTQVEVKQETGESRGRRLAESWYGFENNGVVYTIIVADYSELIESTPEEAVKFFVTQELDHAHDIARSDSHFGTLPAPCAYGTGTRAGQQVVLKTCATFSTDRKRMWMVEASSPFDWRSFPLAEADAFMHNIRIK